MSSIDVEEGSLSKGGNRQQQISKEEGLLSLNNEKGEVLLEARGALIPGRINEYIMKRIDFIHSDDEFFFIHI